MALNKFLVRIKGHKPLTNNKGIIFDLLRSLSQTFQPSTHPHPCTIDRRRPRRTNGTRKDIQSMPSACSFAQQRTTKPEKGSHFRKKTKAAIWKGAFSPTCETNHSNHWNGFRQCVQSHTKKSPRLHCCLCF